MHTYQKAEKNVTTKKTLKQVQRGKVRDLVTEFKAEFSKFKRHYYNWKEQQRQYQICIKNLGIKEIAILIDFSENYDCKLGAEIQSMHSGAAKNSITLHCGMIYWIGMSQSFVTISDNTCHGPNAIWAHLLPILQFVKRSDPTIEIIHFFSDGPSSQYRQKKIFFLIKLFTTKLKLKYITWSFSESGYSKGVADGIGGAVKRQLDRRVAYGHNVTDADDAYQHLSTSMKSVKCFKVSDSDIENMNKIIPTDLIAVPQTIKLHQIISVDAGRIRHRQLRCFCGDERGLCICLNPETHSFDSDRSHRGSRSVSVVGIDVALYNKNRVVPTTFVDKTDHGGHDAPIFLDSNQNAAFIAENDQSNPDVQTISIIDLENVPQDESDGGITTVADIAPCSKTDQSDLNIVDFTVSLSQNANPTDSVMEINLNVDDVLNLEVFDNVIKYPQPGFDIVLDTVDTLTKYDTVGCLTEEKENENKIKRKNNTLASENGPSKKKLKVILPIKEEKCRERSLKTIIHRNFTCHMCKMRKLYVIKDMTKCIACKNWVCRSCCNQPAIDYICDRCFESD
ncbi:hypothetical protein HF086_008636 [Spodoptera exigua]|uniref:Uncharacterized protein n=1 Tax=Spodoptera exigua TaxID=7107 RepID=A0A922M2K3_SPOEX|nr:hypothetical protein HF086_008636 [Spodoptera exigua]